LRGSKHGVRSSVVPRAGDVATATVLVFLTGGPESPFTFTSPLTVVGAAILLGQRGALAAASACSLSLTALTLAVSSGTIRPPVGTGTLAISRLGFICARNVVAHSPTAILAAF